MQECKMQVRYDARTYGPYTRTEDCAGTQVREVPGACYVQWHSQFCRSRKQQSLHAKNLRMKLQTFISVTLDCIENLKANPVFQAEID